MQQQTKLTPRRIEKRVPVGSGTQAGPVVPVRYGRSGIGYRPNDGGNFIIRRVVENDQLTVTCRHRQKERKECALFPQDSSRPV